MRQTHGPVNTESYFRAMSYQPEGPRVMPIHVLARNAIRYEQIQEGDEYLFFSNILQTTGPKRRQWTSDYQRMYQLCRDQAHFFAPYYQVPTATLPVHYMRMWQMGWTFDMLHQKYIRYQAYPWPPDYSEFEFFHMWVPVEHHILEEYEEAGWVFNYLMMRWDNQNSDEHIDHFPYPNAEIRHYPEFVLPADAREVQRASEEGFYYARPPPYGMYRTSDSAEDTVRNSPSTGIVV